MAGLFHDDIVFSIVSFCCSVYITLWSHALRWFDAFNETAALRLMSCILVLQIHFLTHSAVLIITGLQHST